MNLIMYQTFLNTFCVSSLMCFFVDVFAPHYRVNTVSRETILTDYQNMFPRVVGNVAIAYPYFYIVEKYITQTVQPNTYSLLVNIALWIFFMDIMFYSIHRAFHSKYLYHYHAIHHTYRYT